MSSQRNFPFKHLEQYNMVEVHGIKCKLTTNEPLAITLLGTDRTPIVSNKDPMSKLLLTKAHVRDTHDSLHQIHSSTSTTLSKLMTGRYGTLLVNGEDLVKDYIRRCMNCRKMNLLHYISPVGMSDNRMMPTVRPFMMVSIDPITTWPIIMPDSNTKKLPVLVVMCRQTGFTWHKLLLNWST